MIWEILSLLAAAVVLLLGAVGCIVPVIPGPLIALAAPLAISLAGAWGIFQPLTLVLLTLLATLLKLASVGATAAVSVRGAVTLLQ